MQDVSPAEGPLEGRVKMESCLLLPEQSLGSVLPVVPEQAELERLHMNQAFEVIPCQSLLDFMGV